MNNFKEVRGLVKNSLYCSLSIIDKEGHPHTSPIGSVYLTSPTSGYFIEMFTTSFKDKAGKIACIMAVNTSIIFWIKAIITGRFKSIPGTRLYITIGELRKITDDEKLRFEKKVRPFKGLKGHTNMWSSASYIRPFTIDGAKDVSIGMMTKHLEI
jgi:hypothetical protein